MFAFFIILLFAMIFKSAPLFALAFVFSILLGASLAAGEPIEFFTGAFTLTENADQNVWREVPDLSALTVSNSAAVYMWHFVLLYGSFVWLVAAYILAKSGKVGFNVEERR